MITGRAATANPHADCSWGDAGQVQSSLRLGGDPRPVRRARDRMRYEERLGWI